MSLSAVRAKVRTADGDRCVSVSVAVPGHDRAALEAEAAKYGAVLNLGIVTEGDDVFAPVRPCGHGSAEMLRMVPGDYLTERGHAGQMAELERIHGL